MNHFTKALPVALLFAGLTLSAEAKQDVNRPAASTNNTGRIQAGLCLVSSSRAELDINNVRAGVLNGGDMWWDLNNPRYEVPKVTEPNRPRRHSIFAGAIWIGGQDLVGGNLYVAAQTYRQGGNPDAGFWPGPLNDQGQVDRDICTPWNSHAKINRSVIDNFRGSPIPGSPAQLPQSIREWPGRNNPYLDRPRLNQELAPFVDLNNDGTYDPMLGDYPDIRGDQAIWWVMNDVGNAKVPFTPAIGLEVDVMAFAFQTSDQLNNMTFYQQKLINKGGKTLGQTWMGQWVDPDLGYFNDDYVGCDVARGLGFCYNGDENDEGVTGYGIDPPAVAVDFFEGPIADANDGIDNDRDSYSTGTFDPTKVDEPGEKIIMSNFVYYNNDFSPNGNPEQAIHFYNYLRSRIRTGQELAFGGDGLSGTVSSEPYAFMFPSGGCGDSDPYGFGYRNPPVPGKVPPYSWSESDIDGFGRTNVPADRRFLQSAGPFTLLPGAVNVITTGVIWGQKEAICPADDKAQALFNSDFKLPSGPPAPVVGATALDRQIILSIQPGTRITADGPIGTESYAEIDSTLPSNALDRVRRFEGYLVYETKSANLSGESLSDPDKARLIARGDIINGVTQIINYEFNQDVNAILPVEKISADGGDKGVFHTLNITTTAFAEKSARLVNFKRYYFKVVPYSFNADQTTLPSGARVVQEPYLAGQGADVAAIPSKPVVLNGGTILNASAYDQVPIQRVWGQGAGGQVLEITDQDEADILRDGQKLLLNYEQGKAPITVRIYDPLKVRDAKFAVKLSSRLLFSTNSITTSSTRRSLQIGDIIVSTGQYQIGETGRARTVDTTVSPPLVRKAELVYIDNAPSVQRPGRAIVRNLVSRKPIAGTTSELLELEIEMLNDHVGGTFTAAISRYQSTSASDSVLLGYESEPRNFETVDGQFKAVASEFNRHDFWKWRPEGQTDWNFVNRRVSEVNEELIPEYGLTIQIQLGRTPGYRTAQNNQTSFLEASLTHTGTPWLAGVPSERGEVNETLLGINWLLPSNALSPTDPTTKKWDPNGTYSNILPVTIPGVATLGGTWGAYTNSTSVVGTGAQYRNAASKRINNLRSVDVVFTSDKSKWTRVPVLQINWPTPFFALTKKGSTKLSINKDGQPDGSVAPSGSPSTGMGWFPGYAIDLDRGVRLNMMFAENSEPADQGGQGPDKGADLVWAPDATKQAGRSFVYVLDTKYDEGREMERRQDEAALLTGSRPQGLYKDMYEEIMWVGYPKLRQNSTLLASEARVRIRVDREFTSYPDPTDLNVGPNTNPEYTFSLSGQAVSTGNTKVACEALSLVRAVPNPYYAFSQYEQRQLDNIVKITNLPRRCDITVYTLNGTLVRRLKKDDPATFLDFNLKNDAGLPIASGVYLFHVNAPTLGCETIVKWFGIMRPIDLDTF